MGYIGNHPSTNPEWFVDKRFGGFARCRRSPGFFALLEVDDKIVLVGPSLPKWGHEAVHTVQRPLSPQPLRLSTRLPTHTLKTAVSRIPAPHANGNGSPYKAGPPCIPLRAAGDVAGDRPCLTASRITAVVRPTILAPMVILRNGVTFYDGRGTICHENHVRGNCCGVLRRPWSLPCACKAGKNDVSNQVCHCAHSSSVMGRRPWARHE